MTKSITNIIFSRNRPLQLKGYLESLYTHFPCDKIDSFLIYKRDMFDKEYQEVFRLYPNLTVIAERDFRTDVFALLDRIDSRFVQFGVDDVVYFDSVDFNLIEECFDRFPGEIVGFSLRHGLSNVPDNEVIEIQKIRGQPVYKFDWKEGKTKNTSYPFELQSTIYETELIRSILHSSGSRNPLSRLLFAPSSPLLKAIGRVAPVRSLLKYFNFFYNPNTLESWNCRWYKKKAVDVKKYLYFQNICAAAIQVNVVNTSTHIDMYTPEDLTVESLNRQFRDGYDLDIRYIAENKPKTTHCGPELFRLCKRELHF